MKPQDSHFARPRSVLKFCQILDLEHIVAILPCYNVRWSKVAVYAADLKMHSIESFARMDQVHTETEESPQKENTFSSMQIVCKKSGTYCDHSTLKLVMSLVEDKNGEQAPIIARQESYYLTQRYGGFNNARSNAAVALLGKLILGK